MSKRTALYDDHVRLGGRMVDFHGWELPVQYEGILAEHRHCRGAACLFDTSHMGQILIRTSPAALNRVVTQNAQTLRVGRGRYGFLLDAAGRILDDTILMRLDEAEFFLVVNAGTADADVAWVRSHLPADAGVECLSAQGWGKIDLQGPESANILAPLADQDLRRLKYFAVRRATVLGRPGILSRTGYTGELGYEIFAPSDSIVAIFRELVAHEAVHPAGLGARDSLRLEMGYPLYGDDIDGTTTPFEAGLGVFVQLDHDFIGAGALAELADQPPDDTLAAFQAASRKRAWRGDAVCHGGHEVGRVTSAAFSPSLGVSIGMGYIPAALAEPGTELTIRTPRGDLPVSVSDKPLYEHGTCRTSL